MAGKRLRKKIRELSGLDRLTGEDRLRLASEILDSIDMKQDLCLQCPGLTYKDIERTMKGILSERHYNPPPKEEDLYPEKYGKTPKQEVSIERRGPGLYTTLTKEDVMTLMKKSDVPVSEPMKMDYNPKYSTYTREEVAALMQGTYHPNIFRYKNKKAK